MNGKIGEEGFMDFPLCLYPFLKGASDPLLSEAIHCKIYPFRLIRSRPFVLHASTGGAQKGKMKNISGGVSDLSVRRIYFP